MERTDELRQEQTYAAESREALADMLFLARHRVETGAGVAGDGYTAETLGRMLRGHAKELAEDSDGPPYFGRLDFGSTSAAGDHRGQRYYIGRRHISDRTGQPKVLDWRAPVSRVFYQASAGQSYGVTTRRRFGWATRPGQPAELTAFEDEHLDREVVDPLHGPDATLDSRLSRMVAAEIERPRVGPMRDIVATIQPEQDELVRAELDESICVQGAPGTGKTAVGLHRAAYLLYTHQRQLNRTGVLVLGPNRAFLSYISAVLPALGEVDVEQRTLDDLVAHQPVRAVDTEAAATVKHDPRMARVLARALDDRIGEPTEVLTVPDGSYRWRVSTGALRRIVAEVRGERLPHALGRERLRARVVDLLQRHAETRETPGAGWLRRMSRARPVTALLDTVWPAVRPADLVAELLGDREALARAADGLLTDAEQTLIAWPGRVLPKSAPWSSADLVLIDEAAGLIDRPTGYGHVIVDEAQDLSPMQCRAIARRTPHGSLTVLGDLAQATTPWAARSWPDQLAHLGKPAARRVALSTGFRLPAAVVEIANRLLATLDVDVPRCRSLRSDGQARTEPVGDLTAATVHAVTAALTEEGSVAVIAADSRLPALAAALAAAGIPTAALDQPATGVRVTALPATLAKGLEYDHVIVVEPAEIVAAEPRGANRLYVVLTRAVSRLDVLHTRPLPAPLTSSTLPGRGAASDAPSRKGRTPGPACPRPRRRG